MKRCESVRFLYLISEMQKILTKKEQPFAESYFEFCLFFLSFILCYESSLFDVDHEL